MARKKNRELKETKIEIIPMIDTMFFLLVFFILSSVGVIKLKGINIDLPEAGAPASATKQDKKKTVEITITILGDGKVYVNKTLVAGNPPNLGPVLQRAMRMGLAPEPADPKQASVIINADPIVPQGMVVNAIDQARAENITNFAIATVADETGASDTKH